MAAERPGRHYDAERRNEGFAIGEVRAMGRIRVTIAGTMGLVALVAAGLTALRHPSYMAANLAFSVALAVQFAALVAVVNVRGADRGFWNGFAICGWGYLALSVGPVLGPATSPYLATTTLLDLAYEHVFRGPYGEPIVRSQPYVPTRPDKWDRWNWPEAVVDPAMHNSAHYIMAPDTFTRIGHSLFSLGIALAGGLLGRRLGRATAAPAQGRGDANEPSPTQSTDHP